ncbi:hypothetical protein ACIQAL_21170 [Pseudomonas sp. NPDC088368]|jgi:hypothetical protein|uniref:hypothetical protein n=1 Tax=Pseudomonas sp. NPDC088368 TaxID=3364453 RepID=UPI003806AB0F
MNMSVGPQLNAVIIRNEKNAPPKLSAYLTNQVLQEMGENKGVLDTEALEKAGLGTSFSAFDMTSITPSEMGLVSKNLCLGADRQNDRQLAHLCRHRP